VDLKLTEDSEIALLRRRGKGW